MRTLVFCALIVLGIWANNAAKADTRETLLSMEQKLEDRIRPVVRAFDPEGHVFVSLEPETKKKALPMTPFMVKGLSLVDASGNIHLRKVEIQVLSKKSSVPESGLTIIRGLASGMGVRPNVTVSVLPAELQSNNGEDALKKAGKLKSPNEGANAESEKSKDMADDALLFIPGGTTSKVLKDSRALPLALISLGLLLEFSLILGAWLRSRRSRGMAQLLEGGFSKLASALENASSGAGGGRAQSQASQLIAKDESSRVTVPSSQADTSLGAFSDEALIALLSDCYWCATDASDSYAAHVWRQIPVNRKSGFLGKLSFLGDYVLYFSTLAPIDLGLEQEPYYLAPLPISHVDNVTLAQSVRRDVSLLSRLPSLRLNSLPMTARERIELAPKAHTSSASSAKAMDWARLTASEARLLKVRSVIHLRTVDEEQEVLQMSDLSHEIRANIPTLGWLAELAQTKRESILKGFNARELATAWVGPEAVLRKLEEVLPSKKRELMHSYLLQIQPSRESDVFRTLHRLSLQSTAADATQSRTDEVRRIAA